MKRIGLFLLLSSAGFAQHWSGSGYAVANLNATEEHQSLTGKYNWYRHGIAIIDYKEGLRFAILQILMFKWDKYLNLPICETGTAPEEFYDKLAKCTPITYEIEKNGKHAKVVDSDGVVMKVDIGALTKFEPTKNIDEYLARHRGKTHE
jgi:hypothetical protein